MIKAVLKIPLTVYKLCEEICLHFYHLLIFKVNKVEYKNMPILNGKIDMVNKGKFVLGQNVEFNNARSSNYIGLFKPCSIYIREEGVLLIGDNSGFSGVSIFCTRKIVIGQFVNCGANVSIWDTDFHPLDFMDRRIHKQGEIQTSEIKIGDDVFIG